MAATKSRKVPKAMAATCDAITAATDSFCREHLDAEYAELARDAVAALCRKRPSPLASGQPHTWACAVLYALGQVNFLSDKSFAPTMRLADLCARFGVGASTGGNKAKVVRDALDMDRMDFEWILPSLLKDHPLSLLWAIDALLSGRRELPRELRQIAVEAGLIPCGTPSREPTSARRGRHMSASSFSAQQSLRLFAEPSVGIDDRAEVDRLLRDLGKALPITALATPELIPSLREIFATAVIPLQWQVTRVEYLGDEGGIMCHIVGDVGHDDEVVLVSITHLAFDDATPCAREIAAYQRHRRERLHLAAA